MDPTQTTEGDPAVGCSSADCKNCCLGVKIESTQADKLVLGTSGIDLAEDIEVLGDLTSDEGALLTADTVRLREGSRSEFVEAEKGVVQLQRDGDVKASFSCACRKADQSTCTAVISAGKLLVCEKAAGCSACILKVSVLSAPIGRIELEPTEGGQPGRGTAHRAVRRRAPPRTELPLGYRLQAITPAASPDTSASAKVPRRKERPCAFGHNAGSSGQPNRSSSRPSWLGRMKREAPVEVRSLICARRGGGPWTSGPSPRRGPP